MKIIKKTVLCLLFSGFISSISGCSMLSDLPSCDSSEVREIATSLIGAQYINGAACVVQSDDNLGRYNSAVAVSNISECKEGTVVEDQFAGKPFNVRAMYVEDMKTSLSKFVVRSQEKANDGLSVSCSFSLQAEQNSAKANWNIALNIRNLNLTLFKKDDKGNRPYEYRWE